VHRRAGLVQVDAQDPPVRLAPELHVEHLERPGPRDAVRDGPDPVETPISPVESTAHLP